MTNLQKLSYPKLAVKLCYFGAHYDQTMQKRKVIKHGCLRQQSTEEKPSGSSCSFEPTPGPSTSQKPSCVPPVKKSPPPPTAAGGSTNSLDDPKPGPSTTAADFDLEVFDSCSSCSLETDCWGPPGCTGRSGGAHARGRPLRAQAAVFR